MGVLILRGHPYSIKSDLIDTVSHGYTRCSQKCDSCDNFVDETTFVNTHATGRKFGILRDSTCSTRNVIYVAYCINCGKQGVGSTVAWKSRLANYKSHIKKKVPSCCIVKHFLERCTDIKYLRFIIVDVVNNINLLSQTKVDELLLTTEMFCIGALVSHHKGMNGTHDWNRSKRYEKEKE